MFTFQDSSSLVTAQGGKFGLNQKVFLTEFKYIPTEGDSGEYINLKVKVEDKEFNTRFYPINKVFKEGVELTDKNSEEYKKEFERLNKILTASITDIVRCFVPVETIQTALSTPISDFKTYAEIMTGLVAKIENFDKKELDLFLQYQFAIKGDNDRTWLEIPRYKTSYQGVFLVPHAGSGYKEVINGGLKYVNEQNQEHPFKRNQWFMDSNYAKMQSLNKPQEPSEDLSDVFGADTGSENKTDEPSSNSFF